MPRIEYRSINLSAEKLSIIDQANEIIEEYTADGLDLTLRQLYYQFVSRGLIANKQTEYKRLGDIIGDARMAGMVDWDSITDRTRSLRKRSEWDEPKDLIEVCAESFRIDRWKDQKFRPEVWIEKDALVGVIEGVCETNGIAYFSCRGYTSLSEVWAAGRRLVDHILTGQRPVILHLGDHDPSGVDMSRDIIARLATFIIHDLVDEHGWDADKIGNSTPDTAPFVVQRIALTMDQVKKHNPPPNPAKITDSRAVGYIKKFGNESWELDALDPRTIVRLIEAHLRGMRDDRNWKVTGEAEEIHRSRLAALSGRWGEVCALLDKPTTNGKKRK